MNDLNINRVIELGQQIKKPELSIFSEFTLFHTVGLIVLVVIGLWVLIYGLKEFEESGIVYGVLLVLMAILWFVFLGIASAEKENKLLEEEIAEWKEDVALPYINSLEREQKEIVFIKIEPELSHETKGSMVFGSGTITSSPVEKTPISVSFKDGGVITRTDWVETRMELTDQSKPYIQFQRLTKDLGHGIKAGYYNPKVFLPESYEFKEIK